MARTVAVFFGGRSNEHDISVITGMLAVNLLRESMPVLPVYLKKDGGMVTGKMRAVQQFAEPSKAWKEVSFLPRGLLVGRRKVAVTALNCCHGGMGEDGTLSALFRWYHIPSASPDTAASAIFMDKTLSKFAARGMGLPVLASFSAEQKDKEAAKEQAERMGYPVIVKPARLGSSIGVKVARGEEELEKALDTAFLLDGAALVEQYLSGKRDLNCAAYRKGDEVVVSPVEEVFSDEEILTFSEKYEGKGARTSALPADLPPCISEEVQAYTKRLYEGFRICGAVRADFLLSDGKIYFNELNTVPGSLACYLFGNSLSESRSYLSELVANAREEEKREIVSTGLLQGALFSGGKKGRL